MEAAAARRVRTVAAGAERPSLAAEVPHARVDRFGILRIEGEHRTAGREVRALERLRPGLAAVGGFENAALVGIAPEFSGRADVHGVRVGRVDGDLRDALRLLETDVGPVVAAIGRFVDAVTDGDAVARPRLAGPGPDRFRILRIDGDRADRLH